MVDENEAILKGSTKYIMLSARITPEANNLLEMALAYLQNVDNRYKYSKQKAVDDIVRLGASAICRQFENEVITEEIPEFELITESIQIVEPTKKLELVPKKVNHLQDTPEEIERKFGLKFPRNSSNFDDIKKREKKDDFLVSEKILNRGVNNG